VRGSLPALSLRQLCASAGLTQGAFYSNFMDRDALVLEIMERHLDDVHHQLSSLAALSDRTDVERFFEALSSWLRELDDREDWATLAVELRLHSRRDRAFADKLAAAEARNLAGFAKLLEDLARRFDRVLAMPALPLARMLLDQWYMMVLRDPGSDHSHLAFVTVLRQMLIPTPSA
jgi:AcrR family transcriptional regulator